MALAFIGADISHSSTLGELLDKFDARTAEIDSGTAFYTDSMAKVWINMAVSNIVTLGGYLDRYVDFKFYNDSSFYPLPENFKAVKSVMLKVTRDTTGGREFSHWIQIPPQAPEGSQMMTYTISRSSPDSAEVNLIRGELVQDHLDILFSHDSAYYGLPENCWRVIGIMVRSNEEWIGAALNELFITDTFTYSYFHYRSHQGSQLYFKSSLLYDDDTIRVFYTRMAEDGDTLRVSYSARAETMAGLNDSCDAPEDLDGLIIEEALSFYEQAKRRHDLKSALWQQIRIDMGVLKRE